MEKNLGKIMVQKKNIAEENKLPLFYYPTGLLPSSQRISPNSPVGFFISKGSLRLSQPYHKREEKERNLGVLPIFPPLKCQRINRLYMALDQR